MDDKKEEEIDYDEIGFFPRAEVQIFPERLLADHHVEEFLERIKSIEGITQIILTGPKVYSDEPRYIKVGDKQILLKVQVGKLLIEVDKLDVIKDIKEVCDECFKFGYRVGIGRYSKWRETTMDHVRGHDLIIQKDMLE